MTPPRTTPPPSRSSPSRASSATPGAGGVVLLAVFCSVLASAATCFVIIRFSLVSPAAKPAATVATFPPLPTDRKPAATSNRAAARGADPVASYEPAPIELTEVLTSPPPNLTVQRQVAAAAPAVLELIATVRNPEYGYIVGSKHSQLGRELQTIETLANRITQNPSLTADETATLLTQYSNALTAAINRAENIASRETEDPTSVEISRTLKARLEQTRDALPQP
jgi:hypothetical protein